MLFDILLKRFRSWHTKHLFKVYFSSKVHACRYFSKINAYFTYYSHTVLHWCIVEWVRGIWRRGWWHGRRQWRRMRGCKVGFPVTLVRDVWHASSVAWRPHQVIRRRRYHPVLVIVIHSRRRRILVIRHRTQRSFQITARNRTLSIPWQQPSIRTPFPSFTLLLVHRRGIIIVSVSWPRNRRHLRRWSPVRTSRVILRLDQSLMIVSCTLVTNHSAHVIGKKWSWMVLWFHCLTFPSKTSGSSTERAFFKHELTGWVYSPVMSFSWPSQSFREFDEAFVEGEVMADGVLPSLVSSPEEGESLLEKRVDFAECESFCWWMLDCHDDQGDVRVRRFFLASDSAFFVGWWRFWIRIRSRIVWCNDTRRFVR